MKNFLIGIVSTLLGASMALPAHATDHFVVERVVRAAPVHVEYIDRDALVDVRVVRDAGCVKNTRNVVVRDHCTQPVRVVRSVREYVPAPVVERVVVRRVFDTADYRDVRVVERAVDVRVVRQNVRNVRVVRRTPVRNALRATARVVTAPVRIAARIFSPRQVVVERSVRRVRVF